MNPLVVAITGASGSSLANLAIDRLLEMQIPVELVCSTAGRLVWAEEMEESFGSAIERWQASPDFNYYGIGQVNARIASGSFPTQGMLIIPCSMNTVASISHGISENLIQRCADVTIKEGRKLVIVPRESPLSAIHLENMLRLAKLGVTVLTPDPAFYLHPQSIGDIVDFVVSKALLATGVTKSLPMHLQYSNNDDRHQSL
jgi:4-hydroxy-3-polyprenylbenzoate decarboxylase